MYHRRKPRSHKKKKHVKRGHRKTGGSMMSRLAVPAGLLVLQQMMHSRKRGSKSGSNKSMRRSRSRSRR